MGESGAGDEGGGEGEGTEAQSRPSQTGREHRAASTKSMEKRRKHAAGRVSCWLQQAQKLAALNGLEEVVNKLRAGEQARGTNELQHSYWGWTRIMQWWGAEKKRRKLKEHSAWTRAAKARAEPPKRQRTLGEMWGAGFPVRACCRAASAPPCPVSRRYMQC